MSLDALARDQHGVVTTAQLLEAGYSESAIRWAVKDRRLTRLFSSAYCLTGVDPSWTQRAHAATLLAGSSSALSHITAGSLWRIDGCAARTPIHVTTDARVALPSDFVVHTTKRSFPVETIGGLRVTSLARTLLDLAESLDDEALEVALDSASHRWPFLEQQLDELIARWPLKTSPGAGRVLELLDLRGGVAAESPLETRARRAIRAARLPRPRLQFDLLDGSQFVVRLDFAWPAHRVAVHCDGFAWHGKRRQFELDATQRSRMAALDWVAIIVTHRGLKSGTWLADLERAIRTRTPQLSLR